MLNGTAPDHLAQGGLRRRGRLGHRFGVLLEVVAQPDGVLGGVDEAGSPAQLAQLGVDLVTQRGEVGLLDRHRDDLLDEDRLGDAVRRLWAALGPGVADRHLEDRRVAAIHQLLELHAEQHALSLAPDGHDGAAVFSDRDAGALLEA